MRAKVEPTFADRTIINHKEYLTNVNLMTTTAVDIKSKEVMTKDGRLVPYDYLIIATGHHDPYPVTKGDRLREFQAGDRQLPLPFFLPIINCLQLTQSLLTV